MSNNTELNAIGNSNEWIDWIEEGLSKKHIKYYEYEHFSNIQEIGSGGFGKVYRANWRYNLSYLALKSFFNLDYTTIREIVSELKHQREVDFHENIIRFHGITTSNQNNQNENDHPRNYLLVIEYADGSTLRNYLKNHFINLTWSDKFKLALQLACAVSCLHGEGIVHRDLHSKNILVHQGNIKLADFGLSKRIEEASNSQSKLFGIIPYIDPKSFNSKSNDNKAYALNEKSDVYSIGILLWEISSGQPPFCNEPYDIGLAMDILQGRREKVVPNTPEDYVKIYTDCWNGEPENRPTIRDVVAELKQLTMINNSPHGNLSQLIQNFSTKEMESSVSPSKQIKNNFDKIVNEIVDIFNKLVGNSEKQKVLNYLNKHKLTAQEIYNSLLNNQNDSKSIVILGEFNYFGIGTDVDKQKAFELWQKAADLGDALGINNLGYCYQFGTGTSIDNQKAFELYQKAANLGNTMGIRNLGYCHQYGIGTSIDNHKAFEFYQKAANLGSISVINNLGYCYHYGIGTNVDEKKTFELYQQIAKKEDIFGINSLAYCYEKGIGTSIDRKKAFELYQMAAELGDIPGMNNLGYCYQNGIETSVDNKKAFKLYQKAANLGNPFGIYNLGYCYQYGIGTDINEQKSLELYQKAADLGNNTAQYKLAFMYENGKGVARDINQAIYWYKKSAEQGYQNAQNKLKSLENKKNDIFCLDMKATTTT